MGEAMHYTPRGTPNVKWDDELDSVLVKHTEDGKSASEIAALMGRGLTRNSVVGRWHRLRAATGLKVPVKLQLSRPRDPKPAKAKPSKPVALPKSVALVLHVGIGQVSYAKRGRDLNHREHVKSISLELPVPSPFINGARIGLMQLTSQTCRWPLGDPGTEDFCFCGHAPRFDSPYCEYHARAAYQPLQDKRLRVFA